MPFSIKWFNEDADILVVTYSKKWTWEEVRQVNAQVTELYLQAGKRIDCICDMTGSAYVAPNFGNMTTEVTDQEYPNLELVVYVSSPFFRELVEAYERNYQPLPYRSTFANSIEEAFDLILQDRKNDCPD